MARNLLTLLTLACFTGCSTLQPLADVQPASLREQIQPGQRVEVTRVDGSQLSLKVEEVTDSELVGIDDGKRHRVAFSDIRAVGRRVMTGSDKVWTTVLIVGAVGLAVVAASGDGLGGGGRDGPDY